MRMSLAFGLSFASLLGTACGADVNTPDTSTDAALKRTCRRHLDAPVLAISTPAAAATVAGSINVQGTAMDSVTVSLVEVQVDDGAFMAASGTSVWTYALDTGGLSDGAHTVTVRATDCCGLTASASVTIEVENAARVVLSAFTVDSNNVVTDGTVTGSVTYSNTGGSAVTLASIAISATSPDGSSTVTLAPTLGATTLGPGESVTLSAGKTFSPFDALGTWSFAPTYVDAAGVTQTGPAQTVTASHRVVLGTAVNNSQLFSTTETIYPQTFLQSFDSMTAEYEMKIGHIEAVQGTFTWDTADAMVDYALANGKSVRGHTLVWWNSLPGWLANGTWTRETLIAAMQSYITTVVTRYKGRIHEWDVVNEALNDDGTYRPCLWLNVIGPDYIAIAFQAARAADPDARLFYNDYNAERVGTKSTAIFNALSALRAQGIPVDGFGMQAHISTTFNPSQAQLEANISRFAAAGMVTEITELDVKTSNSTALSTDEKLALEGTIYGAVAAGCQAQPTCVRLTTWGITDKYTWLGSAEMPLMLDTNYAVKPAWSSLMGALGR